MDEISAATIWQASNVTTNAQRIIVRHLSDFVGNRLIVPESCISTLGQIMFTQNLIQSFWMTKKSLLDQTFGSTLTRSLLRKYEYITNKETLISILSKIDIIIRGDHG